MYLVRAALPFVAVAALVAPTPALAVETGLVGHWLLDPVKSDDIDKAITATVDKVNFVIRGFASGRLKNTNPAYKSITIAKQGANTSILIDERKPFVAPSNGSKIAWKREDGAEYDVTLTWTSDNRLEQSFSSKEGSRTNVYTAEGGSMSLDVKVTSDKLPVPLTYKLAYKRGK
jgi:hypothetical protein